MSVLDRLVRSRYRPENGLLVIVRTGGVFEKPMFGRVVDAAEKLDPLRRRLGWEVTVDCLCASETHMGPSIVKRIGQLPLFFALGPRHRKQVRSHVHSWAEQLPKGIVR